MSPLTLALLRRLAGLALFLALGLAAGPPLLRELGLLGPSVDEQIEMAARTLEAAVAYGAPAEQPERKAAEQALARARQAARRGEAREARRALQQTRAHAISSQRGALATREDARRRAQAAVTEIDRALSELEDLHAEASRRADKATASRLLTAMKQARAAGGALFLAFEEGSFAKALELEPEARRAIAATRDQFVAALANAPGR